MDIFSYLLGKQQGGSSSGDRDWSEIGYSSEPESIQDGFDYAKNIKDNWNSSVTTLSNKFNGDTNLIYMPLVDTSNVTNMQRMFYNCYSLVEIPFIDTSNVTFGLEMFYNCSSLKNVPLLNFSKINALNNMFYNCASLKEIPLFDISEATQTPNMFYNCNSLEAIPALNTSKVIDMTAFVAECLSLKTIQELNLEQARNLSSAFKNCTSLTNLGGFLNLGQNYPLNSAANNYSLTLNISASNKLTHESLMNVINKVYDIAAKGVATQKITIGNTNIAKLTAEEIVIATNKGWSIS